MKSKDYYYRGHEIKRTTRPSKNWRYGDLSFWWVPSLDGRRSSDVIALLGRDTRSLFQTRIDAERAVDEALDGPLPDRACTLDARIIIDNPGRAQKTHRGKVGTVRRIDYESGYDNRSFPSNALVDLDDGESIVIPTYTFKPIPLSE